MRETPPQTSTARLAERRGWLGGAVIAGVVLYVVLDAILQALPPHYSPISQAESDLGVGPYGWLMSLNFVVRGLVALAVVAGIQHTWTRSRSKWLGQWLLLLWALGDVLLAFFATDVPPSRRTIHGDIHFTVALVIFLAVASGQLILARVAPTGLRQSLLAIAFLDALALQVLLAGLFPHYTGLTERAFIGLALLWMLVVGLDLLRAP